ncbi:MAG: DNA primase [Actinomycetota bacterium]|nr:DNA primase [Actinomycetota bacterium]
MAISDDDIERIRSTVSIVDVVAEHVSLRKAGRNHVGLCPFHAEKTPSFNVREETGRYKCFGCEAAGDVFSFVQAVEHVDFVGAVESLAGRARITLNYTTTGQTKQRARRKRLVGAMEAAVEWYHERLLTDPTARLARDYLRSRGLGGDEARAFKLGWAPDSWDELSRNAGVDAEALQATGLAFMNRRNRLQDSLRGRIVFPIFSDSGEAVALGGRVLPGAPDPAKYKNSPETEIYSKSRTLYGLNWAKAEISTTNQVVVCEGYTDVIGFFRVGVKRAVATCGTAFTEEHVRLLKRYANRIVLAFDADAAGQGAAERFYEWEQRYDIEVSVASLPPGLDPGELARRDPAALAASVDRATPFLGFRVQRALEAGSDQSPEARARLAERAMQIVNEHPDVNVRKLYAGQVASEVGLPVNDLVALAVRRTRSPSVQVPRRATRTSMEHAEFAAIVALATDWNSIAEWLIEELFPDDAHRRAFLALAEVDGNLTLAIERIDPGARDVLERAAVADLDVDPGTEAKNLISSAVRRRLVAQGSTDDRQRIRIDRQARLHLEELSDPNRGFEAAEWLLGWLRNETEGHRVGGQ